VLDRKPHEGEFSSNGATINVMNLFRFLNQQSSIANQQSCLNGVFVQTRFKMPGPLFFVLQNIAIGMPKPKTTNLAVLSSCYMPAPVLATETAHFFIKL
jgi:hypothetical protein